MASNVTAQTHPTNNPSIDGDQNWKAMQIPTGNIYVWDNESTYIKRPPYFDKMVDPKTSIRWS